jgi:uncharacterized membrane protein YgcG
VPLGHSDEALTGTVWQNQSVAAEYGLMTAEFDAVPSSADEDVVIGLSSGASTAYTSLAAIVRFASNGVIDVRNGAAYQAASTVAYAAGRSYHFAMTVDVHAKTYSVYVTPPGASPVLIASKYAFRSEESGVSVLDDLAIGATVGSATVANLTVASAWQNQAFATQTQPFIAEFDAVPALSTQDVVIGLSSSPAAAYTDLATVVRFGVNGVIDVRSGASYTAAASVKVVANATYHVRMAVDVPAKIYGVYVTAPGQPEVAVLSNAAFRDTQSTASTLADLAEFDDSGDVAVSNFTVSATGGDSGSSGGKDSGSAGGGDSGSPGGKDTGPSRGADSGSPDAGGSLTFVGDFETGDLSQWAWANQCQTGRITVYSAATAPAGAPAPRQGNYAAKFHLLDTDVAPCTPTDNPRVEVVSSLSQDGWSTMHLGDVVWEAWSIYVPADFPVTCSDCNDWGVLIQEDFGYPWNGSPTMEWDIANVNGVSSFRISRNQTYNDDTPWSMPLVTGRWVDFLVHKKIANTTTGGGFLEAWVDGAQLTFPSCNCTTLEMETEPSDETNLDFHLDQYRAAGVFAPADLYFDGVRVGTTRQAVELP